MSSFWSRILISAAGIPLVLWLMYLGGWPLFGLAIVAALIALHELYWMTRTLRPVVLAGYLGAIATLLGAELGGTNWALARRVRARSRSPSSSRAPPRRRRSG